MTTQLEKVPWADERLAEPVDCDVRLVGTGIGVDLLAAILARGGQRVVVAVPAGAAEPVAMTTVPYTAELLYLLADRFAVPELADLAMFGRLPERLRAGSGIKQSLGFVYHRAGRAADRSENVQFSVPGEHAEWHGYLPDVQRHTRKLAQRYGVRYTTGAHTGEAALTVACAGRAPAAPARVAATAVFAGVTPYEQCRPPKDDGYTQPWSEGSTVHGFRGGWVQVAPFGNHPGATNAGCAVSVSVPGGEDAEDLDAVLAGLAERYPDLGLQLRGAVRAGPWYRSGAVGDEPAGDALVLQLGLDRGEVLFGQDFTLMLELVHATAAILLAPGALASSAARAAAVAGVERFQRRLLAYAEDFAAAGRIATRDFPSWNAYLRAWLLWSISSALALKKVRLDAVRSGDWAAASRFEHGMEWFELAPGIAGTVTACATATRTIEERSVPAAVAAGRVFRLLSRRRTIPPFYRFGTPAARRYRLDLLTRLKVLAWTFTLAPKAYRGMLTADNITAVPNEQVGLPENRALAG